MAKNLFTTLDLNLLHVFFSLYKHRNMRITAAHLFVTQPAISKSLAKLRTHFSDELFVKIKTGLEPTAYAEFLFLTAEPIYHSLELVINTSKEFDPSELEENINIAISSLLLFAMGGKIFRAISKKAPKCNIQMFNWSLDTLQHLHDDKLHIGVNYQINELPAEIVEKVCASEKFKCYVRKTHPHIPDVINFQQATQYELATNIIPDWNYRRSFAEEVFKSKNLSHRIEFRAEQPSTVLDIVRHSDRVAPMTGFLNADDLPGIRALEIIEDDPRMTPKIACYYHYKNRQNPLTLWLTEIIEETFNAEKSKKTQ